MKPLCIPCLKCWAAAKKMRCVNGTKEVSNILLSEKNKLPNDK